MLPCSNREEKMMDNQLEEYIIDDTYNDNPLDGLIVCEADVRRFFQYLKEQNAVTNFMLRVSKIMDDLQMSFMEVNCCYNIIRSVQESSPRLLDEHWYHIGLSQKYQGVICFHYRGENNERN